MSGCLSKILGIQHTSRRQPEALADSYEVAGRLAALVGNIDKDQIELTVFNFWNQRKRGRGRGAHVNRATDFSPDQVADIDVSTYNAGHLAFAFSDRIDFQEENSIAAAALLCN